MPFAGQRIVVNLADVTAGEANGMRALMDAAREATVWLSDLLIAVRARSALDRIPARAGARACVARSHGRAIK